MSIDLNFWKYEEGVSLDSGEVYQAACCEGEHVEGLAALPLEEILRDAAAAFPGWESPDPLHYERREGGSFEISVSPQAVRFDCHAMERADMKRITSLMGAFGCPLYDPQLGLRFDKIAVFLIGEAGEYRALVESALSRLLPRLEPLTQALSWEAYTECSRSLRHVEYNALIHRGKAQTKVTSFMKAGSVWANRPCQCRNARLEDPDEARRVLGELLETSMERAVGDFLAKTYYA